MAIDIGPKISLTGEKQFRDSLKAVNSQIKASASEVKALTAAYEKGDKSTDNLAARQKALQDQFRGSLEKVRVLTAEYGRQNDTLKKLESAMNKARHENGEGSDEALRAESAYTKQAAAVNELQAKLNHAETEVSNLTVTMREHSRMLEESRRKAIAWGDGIEKAGEKISAAGDRLNSIGTGLTVGVTAPLAGAAAAATNFAMDAETSFKKVATIADSQKLPYEKLKKDVMAASNETGIAITDYNEALYSSISAGVDSGKAIQFTSDMVKLAKGGFTDTAKAVDVVTTVLNAYGLEADKAESISDKLITTQNLGKTTVDELASSLGKVIPTAKNVNVDIDNVAAAMAVLTKNGIATAEASTYYNSMLNELGKSGSTADAALQELSGKSFKDLVTEGKPVTDILQMLADYAGESGKSLSDMFGSAEASKAALTLMKEDGREYNEILGQMAKSAGAANSAFEEMDSGTAAQMQKALNELKNTAIDMGNRLLPIVTDAVKRGGELIERFNALDDSQKQMILRTAGIAAAAGPALKVTGTATSMLGKLISGTGGLIRDFSKLSAAKKAAEAVGQVGYQAIKSTEGVSGFSKVLMTLGPQGVVAVAVVGGLGLMAKHIWETNHQLSDSLKKTKEDVLTYRDSFQELAGSMRTANWEFDGSMAAADQEAGKIEALWTQLKNLTDENGNVLESNRNRVEYITGQLNEALGTQLQLEDDTLLNYQEQASAIDKLIEKKKAQMQLDANNNRYQTALNTRDEGQAAQEKLTGQIAVKKGQLEEAGRLLNEELNNGATVLTAAHGDAYRTYQIELQKLEEQYNENAGVIAQSNQVIESTERAHIAFEKGNYNQIKGILEQRVLAYTAAGDATLDSLQEQATEMSNRYLYLRQALKEGQAGITEEMVEGARKSAEEATIEYRLGGGQAGEGYLVGFDEVTGKAVYQSVEGMGKRLKTAFDMTAKQVKGVLEGFGGEVSWGLVYALKSAEPDVQQAVIELLRQTSNGVELSHEDAKKVFSSFGISVTDELLYSLDHMAPELFTQTVELLYQLQNATDRERPDILRKLESLGISMDVSLANGMEKQAGTVVEKSASVNRRMAEAMGKPIAGPGIDAANTIGTAITAAQKAHGSIGDYLRQNPVYVSVNAVANMVSAANAGAALARLAASKVAYHAEGGIFSQPHLAVVAEESPGEAIIPLAASRRSQAWELLNETARLLGADSMGYAIEAGRSMGAAKSQDRIVREKRNEYHFEKDALHVEIRTSAQDPETVARLVENRLYRETDKLLRMAGKG